MDESNFSLVVMAISSDQLRFINGMGTGLKTDSGGLGQNVAETIGPEMGSDALALFLFADGLTFNFDRFLNGLEGALNLEGLLPLIGWPGWCSSLNCCGRGKVFLREHQKTELLGRLQQQIPDASWVGFYTLGEIGPVGKFNCFHNYTAVIVAVY